MSSRLAPPRVPSGTVQIEVPPELEASDGGSSILTSMLPMLGSVGAIIMVSISNAGPTGWLTGGMFLISALGFVFVNGWRQRAQRQAKLLSARREYLAYLTDLRQTVHTAARAQRRERNWRYPEPETLVYLAEEGTRVWERTGGGEDHLALRLGTCSQPLCIGLEAPELPPATQPAPAPTPAAHRLILPHEPQEDLPLAVPMAQFAKIELIGNDLAGNRGLARGIITHLATLQD